MDYPWHQPLWQQFLHFNQQQKLPHAMLMTGAKGLAKTHLALEMARYLLCQQPTAQSACNQCQSCKLFDAGSHPDHAFIEPEEGSKQIKIEQIRALKEKQNLTANISAWKTAVIHPAQAMNNNAANSLLKLLEEPAANTVLILVGSAPHLLPATIRSRCQLWPMQSPDPEVVKTWLSKAGYALSEQQINQLLPLSQGAPITLKKLIDQSVDKLYAQLADDWQQLQTGKANPVVMANSWQQHDLQLVLNIFSVQLQATIKKAPTASHSLILWQVIDCIQQKIKLISSQNNYNKILLTEDFIVSVMQIYRLESVSDLSRGH